MIARRILLVALFALTALRAIRLASAADTPATPATPAATAATAATATAVPAAMKVGEWVVYATEAGWVRVGPRTEYEAKWARKDEINGGTSEEPLQKFLLAPGFDSRAAALKELCDHLTKVQLRIVPPLAGGPARYLTGVYRGQQYSLRLTKGFDEETTILMAQTMKFYKALEYDVDAEWDTLRQYNITPRYVFGRQWLVHTTGHGTVDGPVKEDCWNCSTSKPAMNERHEYYVVLADGIGGTITYSLKEVEGPFLDSYTMARVMKKYKVDTVDLWPPVTSAVGRDVQPRVEAKKIPDHPKDYGDAALPMQQLEPNKALEDWVIYTVEDKWLHCGTRYEFNLPLAKKDVIWAGNAADQARKTLLAPPTGSKEIFHSRKQALRALVGELTEIGYSFSPLADPRETITAKYRGMPYHLRIERGEAGDFVVEGPRGLGYDLGGNIASLREIDRNITPRKTFRKQWLLHATGHGTYDGPVKDDRWMLICSEPDAAKKAFTIPDGMGGTFGYSYDRGSGPFTESYALIDFLRQRNKEDPKTRSTGLYGEDRSVSIDDIPEDIKPVDYGAPTQPPNILLKSVTPGAAMQGDTLGIMFLATNAETACRVSLGTGVTVKNATYFGRDAESSCEQWLATVAIDNDALIGFRTLTVYNALSSYGTLPKAFEIKERLSDLCAPFELVVPAGGSAWIIKQTSEDTALGIADPDQKQKQLTLLRDRRSRLLDALNRLPDLRDQHQLKSHDLESLVKDLRDTESQKKFEQNVLLLKRRAAAESDLRKLEVEYFKAVSPLLESFTDAELLRLTASLQRRTDCLYQRVARALDETRDVNYTYYWDLFSQKKLIYDIHRENLLHTLNGYQTINSMRLAAAQHQLGDQRAKLARGGTFANGGATAALRPFQRKMRDVYLAMGAVGIMLSQAQTEAAMLDQESYFAGVWAVQKQNKNIELANSFQKQSGQSLIFSMKYLLSGGTSLLGAGIDSVKRFFNFAAQRIIDSSLFDTVSIEVTKQIKESREKTELALNTLKCIGGYTDDRSADLLSVTDEGTRYLSTHRLFHEQTSGGLRRLAACYVTDIPALLDQELQIAQEHAALVSADMTKAFNARVGADAKGDVPYKKLLTDPIGSMRVAIQDTRWGGDHFSSTIAYLGKRKDQLPQMELVRHALQNVNYDPFLLQHKLPKSYALYLELEDDNPDFLQWTLTYARLAAQRRLDNIAYQLANVYDPAPRLALQQMASRNRALVLQQATDKQAHIYQLQGADKMMVWDYDGALECFYQAAEWNQNIQPLEKVEALRQDLGWQKSIESGMEVATQVGNMGVQAALFEFLGQSIGAALNVRAVPAAAAAPTDFAEFVWKQFNPFADFVKAAVVEQDWAAVANATAGLGVNVGTQVVQQDIIKKGILHGYFGVEDQWADLLANALVTTGQTKLKSGNSVLTEVAGWLQEINAKFDFQIVDIPLWNQRQEARRSVSDFYEYAAWTRAAKDAREKINPKQLAGSSEAEAGKQTEPLAEANKKVEDTLAPLTRDRLQDLYEAYFPTIGMALTPELRLGQIRKFFTHLKWKQGIMELKMKKNDELNIKVDNLRRELLAMAQVEFFNDPNFSKYKDYVIDYLYIGSAGKKDSSAYKKTDSDIDFTLLVREDTPESVRHDLRTDFLKFFENYSGKEIAGYEMSIMVDPLPKFFKTGESAGGIVDAIFAETNPQKKAANREALRDGIQKTIEQLIQNASDKERYLDRGNLFRHNLFVRLGYFLKKVQIQRSADGAELVDEPASKFDELYGDVPLEPWMAFDAVVGNMGYIFQHALDHPHDIVAYQNVLAGKYAIRGALYSMLLMSPKARERLATLSRAEVEAKGWDGPERIVVEVAKEILNGPGGQKELGLPTTLDVHTEQPLAMDAKAWSRLFDEWNYRKEGLPLNEVVGKPRNLQLDPDQRLVTALMAENITKTEACFKAVLRKSIMEQGTEILLLRNARDDANKLGDTEAGQILELKMKEIMLSQAAVWNRMSREQQNLVMKELPPEGDWWIAIADVEGLKEKAVIPAPTADNPERVVLQSNTLRGWQPAVFREQPAADIARRIILLKERARTSPPSRVLDVAPQPAND